MGQRGIQISYNETRTGGREQMTCIVAVKHNGKVHLGSESAGASGYLCRSRADAKVFKLKQMIFGFTSSFRMGQILRYSFSIPQKPEKMTDIAFMNTVFLDSLRECLKIKGFCKIENGVESADTFIVGYNGQMYVIHDDYQVEEPFEDYACVGCGAEIALGALSSTYSLMPKVKPKLAITLALNAACQYSAYCRPPFNIVSI
jgi:20S proteasome alpha/beta subunit